MSGNSLDSGISPEFEKMENTTPTETLESTAENQAVSPLTQKRTGGKPANVTKPLSIYETIMIAVATTTMVVVIYHLVFVPRIVVADIEGLAKNLVTAVNAKVISSAQAEAILVEAKQRIDNASHNKIVFLGSAVLSGTNKVERLPMPEVTLGYPQGNVFNTPGIAPSPTPGEAAPAQGTPNGQPLLK